ncbi:trigger factor [Chloroflexota bacterium]
MKVTREKTEDCQAFLTIEMEPAEMEESLSVSYRRLAEKAKIPGFRKGKAPPAILERYLGKESILEEVLNHMVPEAYEKAIKEQEIEAIAQPHIDVTQTEPVVVFKAVVPLPPEIELDDYRSIRVKRKPAEATDDKVGSVLEELRHQHATWEPVERPVDFGDLVVIDIESEAGGEPFINRQGVQYQVVRDSPAPAPGFAEQLAGIRQGEEKEFKLKFPADYPKNELAEKEASFKVKLIEIKEEKLPELDDDLAKQVNPDLETLDALRDEVSRNLKQRADEKARIDFEEQTVEAVVELAKVELPPVLIDAEAVRLFDEQSRRMQVGGAGLEEYLKSVNKTEEQLREELRPLATKRVTISLVLGKVVEEEKIEVADSDIDVEIEKMVGNSSENKEQLQKFLDTQQYRESIKQMLLMRKTIQRLTEIAENADTAKAKGKEKKK